MASNELLKKSFTAAAALVGQRLVLLTAADTLNYATNPNQRIIGVVDENGAAAGAQAAVTVIGIAKVEVAGVVAVGSNITAAAGGKGTTTAASGQASVGIALTAAAADGDIIEVLLNQTNV